MCMCLYGNKTNLMRNSWMNMWFQNRYIINEEKIQIPTLHLTYGIATLQHPSPHFLKDIKF